MSEPIFEIKRQKKKNNWASFVISPLERGYGHTLGYALRRVLLTSIPGAAITKVKISGVNHQFSTLKGMREDIVEFLLNLKRVRLAYGGDKPVNLSLSAIGAGEVRAGDIKTPAEVEIANKELVLANLAKGGKLEAKMVAQTGKGYQPAEEKSEKKTINTLLLDATFTPVLRVNFKVEETRVGGLTNYDRLILEITTDGTVSPKEVLTKAASILTAYFQQVVSPKKVIKKKDAEPKDTLGPIGKLSVEEIDLPTRVANALSKAGYDTVEKLAKVEYGDLVKVRNLGEKSFKIIRVALAQKGVKMKDA